MFITRDAAVRIVVGMRVYTGTCDAAMSACIS